MCGPVKLLVNTKIGSFILQLVEKMKKIIKWFKRGEEALKSLQHNSIAYLWEGSYRVSRKKVYPFAANLVNIRYKDLMHLSHTIW